VSPTAEVGVDVERVEGAGPAPAVGARACSGRERAELAAIDPALRPRALLRCWTQKEAVAKLLGCGLGLDLRAVEVTVSPDEPMRVRGMLGSADGAAPCSLRELDLPAGFVGALAVGA
jgi:phosphopantetheinyl transferase